MMRYTGLPWRYLDEVIRAEIEAAPAEAAGLEMESDAESERDRLRRADLNDEIARAMMGGSLWDYVGLLSLVAAAAPGDGILTRLARRLGLLDG